MDRIILHIDFDSFFASVEQQYNPKLRGIPIGVTAANGRTCIIASSREAKRFGIKTGTRTYDAKLLCPFLVLVSSDFIKYWKVSKKFLNICKDYSPLVELFSIDELFIDITSTAHLFGGAYGIITTIKKRIKEEIGEYITASVGISHNKLLAKLASGINKPDGVFEIKKSEVYDVYQKAKLTDVCGIGERIKLRLNKIAVYTLLQLGKTPLSHLVSEFGNVEGHILKNIGLGVDSSLVIPYTLAPEVKSVGRNYCLPRNEYNHRIVLQNLFELCEEVGIKLRRLGKKARTVGVSLRGNVDIHGRQTYTIYIDSGAEIFRTCLSIIRNEHRHSGEERQRRLQNLFRFPHGVERFWTRSLSFACQNDEVKYVRQISVWVSSLEDKENIQQSLFDDKRSDRLQQTIDKINDRFGDHTIRNGFLLYADKLTTVPNGYMADQYERTKLANSSI